MRIDHFVVNIDEKYQNDSSIIEAIRKNDFPYEPKYGKGTKGFKVSNLWIGNEYLEMVHLLKEDGGGWVKDWTAKYKQGHRGMICLMLDVEDIDAVHQRLKKKGLQVTLPEWLEFKWLFNLLTRRMPWRNCYVPFFEKVPFQLGFQQMKDDKARDFMTQYMVPNAKENGIDGIYRVIIKGKYSDRDFQLIKTIFGKKASEDKDVIKVELNEKQKIEFMKNPSYQVELFTNKDSSSFIEIENIQIHC